jgi:nickel-dependent lactate racemase
VTAAETVRLEYGRTGLDLALPPGRAVTVVEQAPCDAVPDVATAVRQALAAPVGSPPLAELARGRRDACILVSDSTRPVPNAALLPPLLAALVAAGMPPSAIRVLIATGLHRPNEGAEIAALLGPDVPARCAVENHDWRREEDHVELGVTTDGVPADVDRRYLDADLKIATGLIEPHLLAGYSGGRKAVCPGICSLRTLRHVHGAETIGHPKGRPGVLDGNPFHRAALDVAGMAGMDFLLNVTLNRAREVTGVFAGDMVKAHEAGVAFCDTYTKRRVGEPFDVVVATGAGDPLDRTFYQSVKGAAAAAEIVKPGGTILLVARCGEGAGSEDFLRVLGCAPDWRSVDRQIHSPGFFRKDQWMAQHLCHVLARARVLFYSEGLADVPSGTLLVERVDDPAGALADALDAAGPGARVAVLPSGPYVLAAL